VTFADSLLPPAALEGLRRMGHQLDVREENLAASGFGRPNGILVDSDNGALRGGVNQYKPAWALGL